ncbi:MAG: hypothetical protein ACRC5G_03310 [Cetobacterium sp.]
MIQKFKKKPVEIEAIQYTGKNDSEISKWSDDMVYPSPIVEPTVDNPTGDYLQIKTLEGVMTAIVGDWIIKGVKSEFYPCKNDIFLMTYDVVVPKDVIDAQKYIAYCNSDIGFMGSPEYYRQKKIVDAYFEPIRQKEKEDSEKAEYLKLKLKYENS